MAIDDRTTGRSYPLPNASNLLSEDVLRLRDALAGIDVDITGLLTALALQAPSANPVFTGTPQAPTAGADTNTAQLATTAFVIGQKGNDTPLVDFSNGTAGSSLRFSSQDHRHPTDTSRAPVDSPAFSGTPTAPTPPVDNSSTRLATTAFVIGQNYVKQTREVFAAPGLTGGGNLAGNITIGPDLATTAEAMAGSAPTTKLMTPETTAAAVQAVAARSTIGLILALG